MLHRNLKTYRTKFFVLFSASGVIDQMACLSTMSYPVWLVVTFSSVRELETDPGTLVIHKL